MSETLSSSLALPGSQVNIYGSKVETSDSAEEAWQALQGWAHFLRPEAASRLNISRVLPKALSDATVDISPRAMLL